MAFELKTGMIKYFVITFICFVGVPSISYAQTQGGPNVNTTMLDRFIESSDQGGGGGEDISLSQFCINYNKGEYPEFDDKDCICGTKLLTDFPLIGNCLHGRPQDRRDVFPVMMAAIIQIVVSLIFIVAVIVVIAGGVMMTAGGINNSYFSQGKSMIYKVVIGLVVLGLAGYVLRLVNPNFFGPRDELYQSSEEEVMVSP